jgi:hypothetical protein
VVKVLWAQKIPTIFYDVDNGEIHHYEAGPAGRSLAWASSKKAPFTAAGRLIPPNDARASFQQTRPAASVSEG